MLIKRKALPQGLLLQMMNTFFPHRVASLTKLIRCSIHVVWVDKRKSKNMKDAISAI